VSTAGDDNDDHGDRDNAGNLPAVQSLAPSSAKIGTTAVISITGQNLAGATSVVFDVSRGDGDQGDNGNDKNKSDGAFTVSNILVNAAGTQLTATVKIGGEAQTGQHIVRVVTGNGESSGKVAGGNIFTVTP
jgi:hypothetical protein